MAVKMSEAYFEDVLRALLDDMNERDSSWISVSFVIGIDDSIVAYLTDPIPDDQKPPVKILIQFNRALGRYNVTVEDNGRDRWAVTPKTLTLFAKNYVQSLTDPDPAGSLPSQETSCRT